ncbi:glutamate-rich protein 6-like [Anoplopoma fimbria]|uniref:glutamate-rich protein 6-like n=1 Tax=Anoplopoma fimbria TaxID=229290 RepID=UPI0023EBE12A|nr:glutamate-rich protein 6-like [Anoplopoma fimbria]
MSQSPSYERESASASPESPKEGDFSPRQLYDNLKSLEEQETCDDQKDPLVKIITDNYSSSALNIQICAPLAANDLGKLCAGMLPQEQLIKKSHWREPRCFSTSPTEMEQPVSPEFMEVLALDGRFITLVRAQTQTDWEWVEQRISFSCQVQKEIEDPQLLQAEVEPEDAMMPKVEHDIPLVGPPRLIAYKPEPKQPPHVEKGPEVESKQTVLLAHCDYCQQLYQPFIQSELLENETNFEGLFCCEQAKQIRELIMREREKLAQKESDRKIDVNPHASVMSEEEREAAKAKAKERLRLFKLQRKPKKENVKIVTSHNEVKHKTSYSLAKEISNINDELHIPQQHIKNMTDLFTLQEETVDEPKRFYKSGKCFLTLCPDGTGHVFYPSGKAAIIISSAEAADFTYIILEDKDVAPSIKGIFTNKGHATCYHPNGMIWLNLTPVGGLCFSETGALRRRWNWLYGHDLHVRNLPFKPLTFALGPHMSVRIHSQERTYITFAYQQNSVHFNVGSKLELIYPESDDKPRQDVLKRYIQMKSSEIYALLGQIQTCMSHHSASMSNIKPHYCSIARTQQLSRQMEKE